MTRTLPRASLFASLLACMSLANATLIEFDPLDQTVDLGDQAAVDILVTPDDGVFVGAFDFIVNYEASLLSVADVIFGPLLGDDLFTQDVVDNIGELNLAEFALFVDLAALQPGDGSSFVLATVIFDTLDLGSSALTLTGNIPDLFGGGPDGFLGDELGFLLAAEPGVGNITVVEPPVTVPEPATWILMMTGLAALWLGRRRRALI